VKNVLCVIGDVVHSRLLPDRAALQKQLNQTLTSLNRRAGARLLSPYTITLGDEFQAVYRKADCVFFDLWSLAAQLSSMKFRFSIATGPLTTPINRKSAVGMDGPAFYLARDGIEYLKAKGGIFYLSSATSNLPAWIQPFLNILSDLRNGWSRNRLKVLCYALDGFQVDVTKIAREMSLSTRAVYKNIRQGSVRNIVTLLELIESELNATVRGL
jgi:hypothetical protein